MADNQGLMFANYNQNIEHVDNEVSESLDKAKMVIEEYYNSILAVLFDDALKVKPGQFMQCYTQIVQLHDEYKLGEVLYEIFQTKIKSYIQKRTLVQIEFKNGNSREFLDEYNKQWNKYTILVLTMKKVFDYLDRFYLKENKLKQLTETSLILFRDNVFTAKLSELRGNILNEIEKDRLDQDVDKDVIKSAIQQFICMGYSKKSIINRSGQTYNWSGEKNYKIYDNEFENQLKEQTNKFYLEKAVEWSDEYNCYEYIKKISNHLDKEEYNADLYLLSKTKQQIIDITLMNTVELQAEALTKKESGCQYMLSERKVEQLTLMYKVFSRTQCTLKFIIEKMSTYILTEGAKLINNPALLNDPIKFTAQLLEFKDEMDCLIKNSFLNDMKFQKARDTAFQKFMNDCPKSPHYIAFYCDNEFKRGLKQLSEPQIETRLDSIVRLFCCLYGRDTFISSYSNLLAARLLNKTSVSDDAEKLLIKKLQVECGHNTVNKIKTMMQDITNSQNFMETFREKTGSSLLQGCEFYSEILTSGHWPYTEFPTCNIPKQMTDMQDQFSDFYKKKFQNRKIMWLFNHGSVCLQTQYLPKSYQIVVNVYQTALLSLFNEKDVITYKEIQEQTKLNKQELDTSLLKLCNPKIKLLIKENPKPVFDVNEKFELNTKFEAQHIKFNLIPMPSSIKMQEGAGGIKSVSAIDTELTKERSLLIEAVCVRIMKARKTENHNDLIEQVIRQVTMFHAQPTVIKKRIESLIERDYIERDPNDRSKYIYKP